MAAGATQHDMACQIELSTAEPLVLLPPKNPTRVQAPKEPVVSADAPVGTRIKVFWQGVKGQPEFDKWYKRARSSPSTRSPTVSFVMPSGTTAGPTSMFTTSSMAVSRGCGSALRLQR